MSLNATPLLLLVANISCLISLSLSFFPEPSEDASPGQGTVPVLRAHAPGAPLHALLREQRDADAEPRGHGGNGVRLPLRNMEAALPGISQKPPVHREHH